MTGIMLRTVRSNLQLKNLAVLGPVAMALAFSITVNWIGGFSDDSPFVGPHTGYLLWLLVGLSEALRNLAFSSGTTQSGIEA
jgi:hypothetical protein